MSFIRYLSIYFRVLLTVNLAMLTYFPLTSLFSKINDWLNALYSLDLAYDDDIKNSVIIKIMLHCRVNQILE